MWDTKVFQHFTFINNICLKLLHETFVRISDVSLATPRPVRESGGWIARVNPYWEQLSDRNALRSGLAWPAGVAFVSRFLLWPIFSGWFWKASYRKNWWVNGVQLPILKSPPRDTNQRCLRAAGLAWLCCFHCWVDFTQPRSVFTADLILRKRVQSGSLARLHSFRLFRKNFSSPGHFVWRWVSGWVGAAAHWCPLQSRNGSAWLLPGLRGACCIRIDVISMVKPLNTTLENGYLNKTLLKILRKTNQHRHVFEKLMVKGRL